MDLFSSFTKTSQTFATRTKTKLNTNQIETATKNKLQSTLEAFNRRRRHTVGIEKDYESKKNPSFELQDFFDGYFNAKRFYGYNSSRYDNKINRSFLSLFWPRKVPKQFRVLQKTQQF